MSKLSLHSAIKSNILVQFFDRHTDNYNPIKEIPEDKKIFKCIDLNSSVKCLLENPMKDYYGIVKWTGVSKSKNSEYVYGIELEDKLPKGTNGKFKCEDLFECKKEHGVIVPINRVIMDSRFMINEKLKALSDVSKSSERVCFCRTKQYTGGQYKGIQGSNDSGYLTSCIFALFAVSDVLDYSISPLINEIETNNIFRQLREVLAWEIVYPLREFEFVSFHRIEEVLSIVQNSNSEIGDIMTDEIDLFSLLEKLSLDAPLLSLLTYKNHKILSMTLQLFVILENPVKSISSQEMINISMVQNEIMFEESPACLIVHLPRDDRNFRCYEYVLPSDTIEISQLFVQSHKTCHRCNREALYQCGKCVDKNNFTMPFGFQCKLHECNHPESIQLPPNLIKSKSKIFMKLKAIVCNEKNRFSTYVKDNKQEWIYFDDTSTINMYNCSIPKISRPVEASRFLNLFEEEMKELFNYRISEDVTRIVEDSCIFVYHNPTKTCY